LPFSAIANDPKMDVCLADENLESHARLSEGCVSEKCIENPELNISGRMTKSVVLGVLFIFSPKFMMLAWGFSQTKSV
jgi:hypothetical protein